MYFGEPYKIPTLNDKTITLLQPTIGDIIHVGESKFYTTLNIFITNTTSYRLPLWEAGIDWNEFSDYNLFLMLYKSIDQEIADLLFENVNFSNYQLMNYSLNDDEKIVLYDPESEIIIDEEVYLHFSQYFREVFNIFPEEKVTKDKTLKQWFIDKDRRELDRKKQKEAKGDVAVTSIQAVISSCVNHPGFKYKLQELRQVGVCEFYDSVKRLQIYEHTTALMKGMYSGFIDSSNIKPESYNFMKEFSEA